MVNFPPLMPSAHWCSHYLSEWIATGNEVKAIEIANGLMESPREFGRFSITDVAGNSMALSLALEGGGRRLRHWSMIEDSRLSEHGDWRKIHLGAMEACLGRKPYFREIEHALKCIYSDRGLRNLNDFNTAIFKIISSFLIDKMTPEDLKGFYGNSSARERGNELSTMISSDHSIINAIASIGKETILALLSMKDRY